jgi:hypothetical protein
MVALTVLLSAVFFIKYGSESTTFYGDSLGYYWYLPQTFIYHNLKTPAALPKRDDIPMGVLRYAGEIEKDWKAPNGNVVDQYTYAIAFMEMPFFLIAHAYEKITGKSAGGFSDTYNLLLKFSSIVYALLGLILVYKILKKYFTDNLALAGTLLIFAATNLFWFTLRQAGMSHVPLFFLYALLIYLTIKVHERPRYLTFTAIGLVAGLITVARPTDILCLLIPLLYNVSNAETARKKIAFIKDNIGGIALLSLAFLVPIIPQLIYWKVLTGHFLYYSYGNQQFCWRHPKIMDGLFYFGNGWLPYSPIMIFALLGLFFRRRLGAWAWCIWLILPLYIYIIYSWYCYRYINGLGSRPMIHLYPLLAIPLTVFIEWVSKRQIVIRALFTAICLFCVALNVSYSIQQIKGIIWSEESNMQYNLQMMFRTHLKYNDLVVNDIAEWQPDTAKIVKVATLDCQHFDDSLSPHYVRQNADGTKFLYELRDEEIQESIVVHYDRKKFDGAKWFKCSGRFMYPEKSGYAKHLMVLDVQAKKWTGCQIENKIGPWDSDTEHKDIFYQKPGTWGTVYYFVKIPPDLEDGHMIKMFIWSVGRQNLFMDDLCLELYKPR